MPALHIDAMVSVVRAPCTGSFASNTDSVCRQAELIMVLLRLQRRQLFSGQLAQQEVQIQPEPVLGIALPVSVSVCLPMLTTIETA